MHPIPPAQLTLCLLSSHRRDELMITSSPHATYGCPHTPGGSPASFILVSSVLHPLGLPLPLINRCIDQQPISSASDNRLGIHKDRHFACLSPVLLSSRWLTHKVAGEVLWMDGGRVAEVHMAKMQRRADLGVQTVRWQRWMMDYRLWLPGAGTRKTS